MKFIFLFANVYDFTDKSGKLVKGASVYLAFSENKKQDNLTGSKPQKFSVSFDDFYRYYKYLDFLKEYEFIFTPDINTNKNLLSGVDIDSKNLPNVF